MSCSASCRCGRRRVDLVPALGRALDRPLRLRRLGRHRSGWGGLLRIGRLVQQLRQPVGVELVLFLGDPPASSALRFSSRASSSRAFLPPLSRSIFFSSALRLGFSSCFRGGLGLRFRRLPFFGLPLVLLGLLHGQLLELLVERRPCRVPVSRLPWAVRAWAVRPSAAPVVSPPRPWAAVAAVRRQLAAAVSQAGAASEPLSSACPWSGSPSASASSSLGVPAALPQLGEIGSAR